MVPRCSASAIHMEQPSEQNENNHRTSRVSRQSTDESKEPFGSSNRMSHEKSQGASDHSATDTRADGRRRTRRQSTPDRKQRTSDCMRSVVAADESVRQDSCALPKKAAGTARQRALISCCKGETHTHREKFRYSHANIISILLL